MSELGIVFRPRVYVEKWSRHRLPELLVVEEQASTPGWNGTMFLAASQLGRAGMAVAEAHGRMVGFAFYKIAAPPDDTRWGRLMRFLPCRWPWPSWASGSHPTIGLLRIAVLPEWQRRGIGRSLLDRLAQEARRVGGVIQAIVPESNLAVQLFLRDAGYKAVRILRTHFGADDGYVMEWPCSQGPKEKRQGRDQTSEVSETSEVSRP